MNAFAGAGAASGERERLPTVCIPKDVVRK
jgi:hypothetical protein